MSKRMFDSLRSNSEVKLMHTPENFCLGCHRVLLELTSFPANTGTTIGIWQLTTAFYLQVGRYCCLLYLTLASPG
jgi:hypothetical protein